MKTAKMVSWLLAVILLLGCTVFPAGAEEERLPPPEIMEREDLNFPYLIFGSYEQDNNLENGPEPIEWLVLKEEDGRAFVVSRYALALMKYYHTIAIDSSVTWETWESRAWLNGEFLEAAFSEAEQERIPTVTVETPLVSWSSVNVPPVNDTEDKIFLLSMQEASRYLKGGKVRRCQPTAYAIASYEAEMGKEWEKAMSGLWNREEYRGNCYWWLRSQGEFPGSAAVVSENGVFQFMGYNLIYQPELYVRDHMNGIRPAMWIDLTP